MRMLLVEVPSRFLTQALRREGKLMLQQMSDFAALDAIGRSGLWPQGIGLVQTISLTKGHVYEVKRGSKNLRSYFIIPILFHSRAEKRQIFTGSGLVVDCWSNKTSSSGHSSQLCNHGYTEVTASGTCSPSSSAPNEVCITCEGLLSDHKQFSTSTSGHLVRLWD